MRIKTVSAIALIGALSGCTGINSSSFGDMSTAYRQVVENYSNENILLNVVRSSKNMPLSFLDIPSVIGTGNVMANAGVNTTQSAGTQVSPPSITSGSLGLSVNNGFTFTQASLDNAQFMQSFLKEIPLGVLGVKGTERLLPRAVSYTLLIENIELRKNNVSVHRFNNDPLDPKYKDFQDLLYLLIESGLTVENTLVKTPLGPPIEQAALSRSLDAWGGSTVDNLAKGLISFEKVNKNGRELYQLVRNDQQARVCVNKYRTQELLGDMLSPQSYCQDSPRFAQPDMEYAKAIKAFISHFPDAKNLEFVIGIRSPGNVFDFLGAVLNVQFEGDGSKEVMLQPSKSVFDSYNQRYKKPLPLFKVYKNASNIDAAATVKYKGITYSVADNDESYTKDVMEFMATLVTIAKIPGAIPASPAVIVR